MSTPLAQDQSKMRHRTSFVTPHIFVAISAVLLYLYQWPVRWLISGAPILTYLLLLGDSTGHRILHSVPLWTIIPILNLSYAVADTSWLLYWFYLPACYFTIFIASLFQFEAVARPVRAGASALLKQLYFANDKIAFFDLPALEIDTEVSGLMVIRGLTLSLSHLTMEVHGVEVGIKLSDDMELAMLVDDLKISLFRKVEVGDVYGNIKGGEFEMTFGELAKADDNATGHLMVTNTPLLLRAAETGDLAQVDVDKVSVKEAMTNGQAPSSVGVQDAINTSTTVQLDEHIGRTSYQQTLQHIDDTSAIRASQVKIKETLARDVETVRQFDASDAKDLRAAVCTQLHDTPSIPHPPRRSVKVSTLRNAMPPYIRKFLHRLPLLFRVLLFMISYFHPVSVKSFTVGGSGKWLQHMLRDLIFQDYAEEYSIKNLQKRISAWLSDANFVVELINITALAQVPIDTTYNVSTQIKLNDVLAYRTQPKEFDLQQVIRLGGADCTITLPSFLLPHHEHLLPPRPTAEDERAQEQKVLEADGKPKTVQAEQELEQVKKDETNMTLAVHAQLPAVFVQELLDFIAALVKATKIIEMEKSSVMSDGESVTSDGDSIQEDDTNEHKRRGFRDSIKNLGTNSIKNLGTNMNNLGANMNNLGTHMRESIKKVAVDAATNDRWIAKLVGKVTRKLEKAQGDIGYSGDVPIALKPYRDLAEPETKILP